MTWKQIFPFTLCLLLTAGCQRPTAPRPADATATGIVERIGEVAVLPLAVPAFASLTAEEKIAAYFLSQAVIAGRDIIADQIYPRQAASRRFLDKISVHIDYGAPDYFVTPFRETLKSIWLHHGVYDLNTGRKIKPVMDSRELYQLMFVALANSGGSLGHLKDLNLMAQFIADTLLNPDFDSVSVISLNPGKPSFGDSPNGFYSGITPQVKLPAALHYPQNSKLLFLDGQFKEIVYRAGDEEAAPGLFANELHEVIKNLEQGRLYLPANRVEAVDLLIGHLQSGDLALYQNAVERLRATTAPVDFLLGFHDRRFDPLHQKALWTGMVFLPDKDIQEKIDRFINMSPALAQEFPVVGLNPPLHQIPIEAKQLLSAISPDAPFGPEVYHDPPYFSEPAATPYRNLIFTNMISARATAWAQTVGREWCYDSLEFKEQARFAVEIFLARAILTELTKPALNSRLVMNNQLSDSQNALLTGMLFRLQLLWVLHHPALVESGLLTSAAAQDEFYRLWVRECLISLRNSSPQLSVQADQTLAYHLLARNVLSLEKKAGKTYCRINEMQLLPDQVIDLAQKINELLTSGTPSATSAFLTEVAPPFDPDLPAELQARWTEAGGFEATAFLFPLVAADFNPMGGVKEVSLQPPQSFTEEMLIFGGLEPNQKKK